MKARLRRYAGSYPSVVVNVDSNADKWLPKWNSAEMAGHEEDVLACVSCVRRQPVRFIFPSCSVLGIGGGRYDAEDLSFAGLCIL